MTKINKFSIETIKNEWYYFKDEKENQKMVLLGSLVNGAVVVVCGLLGALIGAALAIIVHFVYYKFMYKKILLFFRILSLKYHLFLLHQYLHLYSKKSYY